MITETGKVVAIETDGIWAETANQSACSRCAARKGCGQSLLAQVDGHRSYIKASYNGYDQADFREGDLITIGVDEAAVLRGSLLVYCTPLAGLIGGAFLGNSAGLSELGTVVFALVGLAFAALVVRWLSWRQRNDDRYQPVVVRPAPVVEETAPLVVQADLAEQNS